MAEKKPKVEKDNAERWLLTYSDLMNLLLILFILLYSMSQIDLKKFNEVASSLSTALGNSSAAANIDGKGTNNSLMDLEHMAPTSVIPSKAEDAQMKEVAEQVTEIIKNKGLDGKVDVKIEERGVVISINEGVLFKSGSADIESASVKTIQDLGSALLTFTQNHIRVEGHTDNDPIKTAQFPSNWHLSTARATNVLAILVDKVGINPDIISAVGYGQYRPKVPNDTPAHKNENRRVTIVIVKSLYDKAEAGTSNPAGQQASPLDNGYGEAAEQPAATEKPAG